MSSNSLQDFQDKLAERLVPWKRSIQFWTRAADIYTSYKVCQMKTRFVKDPEEREAMWEKQHELGAEKMYSLCSELGGFFLKAAQVLGKPDLAPAAWVRRLVTLYDRAPETPIEVVKIIVESELGRHFDEIFERFDTVPLGSASIAQVHRAKLRGVKTDVAIKVQHPGVEHLMMVDIRNLQKFVLFLQKTDIGFDLFSVTKEVEKQIGYEFDFRREADAMERIRRFLIANNRRLPVLVPRVIPGMVTRKVLAMEYINGIPIMNLGNEMAKRGIDPGGKAAAIAKQNAIKEVSLPNAFSQLEKKARTNRKILKSLTLAYGQMILKSGFFHADPHPGNILICKNSEVALLDYGQVKELPENLRLGYAKLVIAIAENDPLRATRCYKELGIGTTQTTMCNDEEGDLFKISQVMFDTKFPPGVTVYSPFSEDSSLKRIAVQSFPEELFSILRTIQLLRGLSVGLGINYSCAEQWKPIAKEALRTTGVEDEAPKERKPGFLSRIVRAIFFFL